MLNKYQVIVFDWEGTLAEDPIGHIAYAVENQLQNLNMEKVERNLIRYLLEQGLLHTVNILFAQYSLSQQEEILRRINTVIKKPLAYICLISGAFDLVKHLSTNGVDIAIATNKGHESLMRALELSNLNDFFKITCSADQFAPKPCPDMLLEIMRIFSVSANQVLMIGDSVADIEMARAAGVDAIGLDVYHKNPEELQHAGALHVFDSLQQLANFLNIDGE